MNSSPVVSLIVDDEIQIRRFLRAGFELEGMSVLEKDPVQPKILRTELGVGTAWRRPGATQPPEALFVRSGGKELFPEYRAEESEGGTLLIRKSRLPGRMCAPAAR